MPVESYNGVEVVDLPWMQQINPIRSARITMGTYHVFRLLRLTTPGFKFFVEGVEPEPFERGVVVIQNHTHKLDWLMTRAALKYRVDRELSSWIKLRGFNEHPVQREFLARTGNIPLSSRGYVIIGDHLELFGHRPDEDEYRTLRAHIDERAPLPDNAWARAIQRTPRRLLGWHFDPGSIPYRDAVLDCYLAMMDTSMALARRSLNAGYSMHIYPEGSISSRLCPGKIGALQVALALGLELLPVGVSGMNESFDGLRPAPGGQVFVRYGQPWRPDPERYAGFEPFDLDSEVTFRTRLEEDTAYLMERINDLLEPDYQWMPDGQSDGKQGIYRFIT